MPSSRLKNAAYRLLLPTALSPRGKMSIRQEGQPLHCQDSLLRVLEKHHVLGCSLLLLDGSREALIHVSVGAPISHCPDSATMYRVASITKMAAALTVLRLCEQNRLSLDMSLAEALPAVRDEKAAAGIRLKHLLSHTSGLQDTAAYIRALDQGDDLHAVLSAPEVRTGEPGSRFLYCNFGFGLLGCVIEQATGLPLSAAMEQLLFRPLGMRAAMDASTLAPDQIMGIRRILPRNSVDVRVTKLGSIPLNAPDPAHHFGHTAGAMYTDCRSLSRMMTMIANGGRLEAGQLLAEDTIRDMCAPHAEYGALDPKLHYGYGILQVRDPWLSEAELLGHQGFAYGCVDCAFTERGTNRQVIFLNGGASELRSGRMGCVNRAILHWALKEEMPAWQSSPM